MEHAGNQLLFASGHTPDGGCAVKRSDAAFRLFLMGRMKKGIVMGKIQFFAICGFYTVIIISIAVMTV
ncbi:MAG: hypothetical protein AUK35_05425 [Zetaproteobacteria bacterium CG2_30_46_52]|nr:MAG: hypothetical protein AUK35_05425 [Zetaproteobacteria bacterium CG2_30_46_52]